MTMKVSVTKAIEIIISVMGESEVPPAPSKDLLNSLLSYMVRIYGFKYRVVVG